MTATRNGRQWRTPAPRIAAPDETANERRQRVLEIREGVETALMKWEKSIEGITKIQGFITAIENSIAAHEAAMTAMRAGFMLAAEGSNQKARDADALRLHCWAMSGAGWTSTRSPLKRTGHPSAYTAPAYRRTRLNTTCWVNSSARHHLRI